MYEALGSLSPAPPKKAPLSHGGVFAFPVDETISNPVTRKQTGPILSSTNEGTDHAEHHLQCDLSTFHLGFDRWHGSDPGEPPSYHLANVISVERVSHENADAQGGQQGCYDLGHPPT
jgi:hypothetical protein